MKTYDLIIAGAGIAGISAAIYALRYKINALVIGKDMGMVSETAEVENYPGIYPVSGLELINKFTEHAKKLGAKIVYEEITKIEKHENLFIVKTTNNEYKAKAIIYALGGKKRRLGLEEEKKFIGKGISYCATCDARFYKNKVVAVVGGANSAVSSALLLSEFASKVYLIYRRDSLRADPALVEKLKKKKNIEVIYKSVIKSINGEKSIESVVLEDTNTGNTSKIKLDGIFVEFGYVPNSLFAEELGAKISEDGRVVVKEDMSTNVEGLFAAGDITTGSNRLDQIITAASEGAIAANSAYKFLREVKRK